MPVTTQKPHRLTTSLSSFARASLPPSSSNFERSMIDRGAQSSEAVVGGGGV